MNQIREDIKNETFRQMYLLYGEERYLRRQYRQRLRDALCAQGDTINVHCYEGNGISIGEIVDLAETLPFLSPRRVFFITDSGLFKSGGEKMAEYLAQPNDTAYFVFTESEVDKRSKLFKTVQSRGHAAECAVQDENTLKRWVAGILAKEGKKATEKTIQQFLSKTGSDMDNIQSELEKLICFCMDREVITEEDVETVCTARIVSFLFRYLRETMDCELAARRSDLLVDAIGSGQPKKALELYYDLLALREPPMRILFLIARQCNLLMQTKDLKASGFDNRAIASRLGIPPFAAGKYLAQASRFSMSALKQAVRRCVDTEEAVKSGRMNDMMSVEILILTVLGR